jgi:hypothetical protein
MFLQDWSIAMSLVKFLPSDNPMCLVPSLPCKLVLLLKGGGLRTQKTFLGLAVGKRVETSDKLKLN